MMPRSSRVKNFLASLALTFSFLSCGCAESEVDSPLIFSLEASNGSRSCLIAINHLVISPAHESREIVECEYTASAIVFEENIGAGPNFAWSGYERKKEDPTLAILTEATFKKIIPALKNAQYNEAQIKYFLTLHPVAIYRALMYSKVMAPKVELKANLDIQLALTAYSKHFKIIELEGQKNYMRSERQLSAEQLEDLISRMCDLLLQQELMANYLTHANWYSQNLSVQPDIDTAWNKKKWFNKVALGLPDYTILHDVDNRNPLMAEGILNAMQTDNSVLIFIGSAHVGGPNSVLKLLEKKGVKITRIR